MASTTGGTIAITPAALMNEKLMVKSEANAAITIGSVCAADVLGQHQREQELVPAGEKREHQRSDQRGQRQRQIDMRSSACRCEQPSTRAAL